jgi:hypothetical protein
MAKKRYFSGMMPSGMGEFANMPQASFMKEFPMNAYMTTDKYPDTLRAIDRQISGDVMKAKKNLSGKKF